MISRICVTSGRATCGGGGGTGRSIAAVPSGPMSPKGKVIGVAACVLVDTASRQAPIPTRKTEHVTA